MADMKLAMVFQENMKMPLVGGLSLQLRMDELILIVVGSHRTASCSEIVV
jgi:hypothetical protein